MINSHNNLKRTIDWVQWSDPLMLKKSNDNDRKEFDQETEEAHQHTSPVIITPVMIYPLTSASDPNRAFQWWDGFATFAISRRVKFIIVSTPGVSSFTPFGPYEFRIAISKGFNAEEVKSNIDKALNANQVNKEPKLTRSIIKRIKKIKSKFSQKQDWVIYVMPNGKIYHKTGNHGELQEELATCKIAKYLVGGHVIHS